MGSFYNVSSYPCRQSADGYTVFHFLSLPFPGTNTWNPMGRPTPKPKNPAWIIYLQQTHISTSQLFLMLLWYISAIYLIFLQSHTINPAHYCLWQFNGGMPSDFRNNRMEFTCLNVSDRMMQDVILKLFPVFSSSSSLRRGTVSTIHTFCKTINCWVHYVGTVNGPTSITVLGEFWKCNKKIASFSFQTPSPNRH